MNRRDFLESAGRGVALGAIALAGTSLRQRTAGAQEASAAQGAQSAASNVEMSPDAYKPVSRPPKPGAKPSMTKKEVEALERDLACPCPCTLDVYTCRTTDFNCGISPAVHGDVQRLVEGGYSANEIMTALTDTYGDFILTVPRKRGFNLLAWFAPFAALGIGAVGIGALLRSWRRNAQASDSGRAATAARDAAQIESAGAAPRSMDVDATPEELARLEAALRDDPR